MQENNSATLSEKLKRNLAQLIFTIKSLFPVREKSLIAANLKRNWYFLISAMAFFCLTIDNTLGYCIGLVVVFIIMIIISSQFTSVWNTTKQYTFSERIICLLSAAGIVLANQKHFYSETVKLIEKSGFPETFDKVFLIISYFGALCGLFFVFFCLLIFLKEIKRVISVPKLFGDVAWKEWAIYALLVTVSIGFMVYAFSQSQAFYGTERLYDVIYTSDSPVLVKGNVYLTLTHPENDLRQPLFAVFAAPFVGIPHLVGRLFGASASVQAMLSNMVQIVLLYVANFMLTKIMKLNSIKRVCFMLLTSCTYTHLLFTLMMEQYIFAYFWLIFCIYLIFEKKCSGRIALWGAGGTLLTSLILLPFVSDKNPIKDFKKWFADMVKFALEFVMVLLAFCRFDVIFYLTASFSSLSGFTGKNLTFVDKLYQYIAFVANHFVAPDAGITRSSWRLNPVTGINFIGVAVLLLVIVSAILNKNKKSSLFSAGWVTFSVVMLLGLGWGTEENGLILYALYFGWAFLVLLFQLIEKIENKLNIKILIPIISIGCAVAMAVINIPAIIEMVSFAITRFPV